VCAVTEVPEAKNETEKQMAVFVSASSVFLFFED